MKAGIVVAAILLVLLVSGTSAADDGYKIVQVSEYCRHGARTTWYTPNLNLDLTQKYGIGILTPNGMRMHYLLGAQIRKNYESLFGTVEDNKVTFKDIEVFASAKARSELSAVSQMTGLFPFGLGSEVSTPDQAKYFSPPFANFSVKVKGNDALPKKFYPIPISINDQAKDMLFFGSYADSCPAANAYSKQWNQGEYKKYDYLIQDLAKELEVNGFSAKKMYNLDKWDINQLALFSDEIMTYENYHGKKYMDMDDKLFEKVFHAHNVKFTSEFNNSNICRMRADGVARGIIEGMDAFVNGNKDKKMFRFYSGHDTGVFAHMLLLGLSNLQCLIDMLQQKPVQGLCEYIPGFASQFLYELSQKDDKYYVRVLWNGKPFEVCKDKVQCPYDEFKTVYSEKVFMGTDDFIDFCGNKYLIAQRSQHPKTIIEPFPLWIIILVGLFIIIALTGLNLWKYKQINKTISYGMPHESMYENAITIRQNPIEAFNAGLPA